MPGGSTSIIPFDSMLSCAIELAGVHALAEMVSNVLLRVVLVKLKMQPCSLTIRLWSILLQDWDVLSILPSVRRPGEAVTLNADDSPSGASADVVLKGRDPLEYIGHIICIQCAIIICEELQDLALTHDGPDPDDLLANRALEV